jgi:hypothetical protein
MAVMGAKGIREVTNRWNTGNNADLEKGVDIQMKGRDGNAVAFQARVMRREMVSFVL